MIGLVVIGGKCGKELSTKQSTQVENCSRSKQQLFSILLHKITHQKPEMPSERIAKKPENTEKNQNQIHSQTPRKVIKLKKFSRNMPQGTTSSIYEQPPQQSKESSQMEFEKILAFFLVGFIGFSSAIFHIAGIHAINLPHDHLPKSHLYFTIGKPTCYYIEEWC